MLHHVHYPLWLTLTTTTANWDTLFVVVCFCSRTKHIFKSTILKEMTIQKNTQKIIIKCCHAENTNEQICFMENKIIVFFSYFLYMLHVFHIFRLFLTTCSTNALSNYVFECQYMAIPQVSILRFVYEEGLIDQDIVWTHVTSTTVTYQRVVYGTFKQMSSEKL